MYTSLSLSLSHTYINTYAYLFLSLSQDTFMSVHTHAHTGVCACVCVCIYMYICIYMCMYVYIYIYMNIYAYTCKHAYMDAWVRYLFSTHIHVHICTHAHVCVHVCVCVSVRVCVRIYMYIHIYIYARICKHAVPVLYSGPRERKLSLQTAGPVGAWKSASLYHVLALVAPTPPLSHDWFIWATWLLHSCDMTNSYVWHASFRPHVRQDLSICVISCRDVTHSDMWYDTFRVWYGTFPENVLFIWVTRLIHMSDMTYSYEWHDLFIWVTWLMCTCDMTGWYV